MHSSFLVKIGQIKEFDDVLDRELAFLDKGVSLRFWSKNENFFIFVVNWNSPN